MAIASISGLNLQNKAKTSNTTISFRSVSNSGVSMKDTVSFGSNTSEAPQKALKIVKEIFADLNVKPDDCWVKNDLKKLKDSAEKAVTKIKENLPSLQELELTHYPQEVATLGKTKIYANIIDHELSFHQFKSDGGLLKALYINPMKGYVETTAKTSSKNPLLKQSFYSFNGAVKEAQIIKYGSSKKDSIITLIKTEPCSHHWHWFVKP